MHYEIDFDELAELRRQDIAERRLRAQLAAHPDPRDPDYPLDDEGLSPDSAFDALMQDETTVDEAAMDFTPEDVQAICKAVIAAYRAAKFDNAIDDASATQIGRAYYSAIYQVIKAQAEGV